MRDVKSMTSEEKDALLFELFTQHPELLEDANGGGTVGGGTVEGVQEALEQFAAILTALAERVQALEKIVMDDIIGGINEVAGERQKMRRIDGIRGKYGEMFSPIESVIPELWPNDDLWSILDEQLEEARAAAGDTWTDEQGDKRVKEIFDMLNGKISKIRGPAKIEAEIVAAPEGKPVASEDNLKEKIKRMKRSADY